MEINEENLVTALNEKNPDSLEYIISHYSNHIYSLAYSVIKGVGSKEDVEECVSEILTYVWSKSYKYSEERGSFKTWLLVVAKYRALDCRRKILKNINNVSTEELEIVSAQCVENEIIGNDCKNQILQAISSLKEPDKEIFYRRYFFYESIDAIAAHFGITREAIDNRLCRGRKRLREALSDYRKENVV